MVHSKDALSSSGVPSGIEGFCGTRRLVEKGFILTGGHSEPRLEGARQMRLIGEAALDCDIAGAFPCPEQVAGLMHATIHEPGMRRESRRPAKHADQVPGAQTH